LSLRTIELALEELAPATNRAKWIAVDDEKRRARGHDVAASGANFLLQRLGDTCLGRIWRHGSISLLSPARPRAGNQKK